MCMCERALVIASHFSSPFSCRSCCIIRFVCVFLAETFANVYSRYAHWPSLCMDAVMIWLFPVGFHNIDARYISTHLYNRTHTYTIFIYLYSSTFAFWCLKINSTNDVFEYVVLQPWQMKDNIWIKRNVKWMKRWKKWALKNAEKKHVCHSIIESVWNIDESISFCRSHFLRKPNALLCKRIHVNRNFYGF